MVTSAISEPLRKLEKKVETQADLLLDGWVQRRVYFQTGLFRRGCGLSEGLAVGSGRMQEKGAIQFLSAVRQLLLVARGRERLSHKSSSS